MPSDDLLALYDDRMREPPPTPPRGAVYERVGPLVRIVGQFRGFVSAPRDVGVRGVELDRLIAEQRDYFAARGEAVEWKVRAHDEPTDLPDRLRAAGFVAEDAETVLVGSAPDMVAAPPLPNGVRVRRVSSGHDLRRLAEMLSAVWGQDWSALADDLGSRIEAAPDDIAVFVAEAGGEIVSAAWLVYFGAADVAGLWGGSTRVEWRGRGIYRALVGVRAVLAVDCGIRHLQVDASEDSAPILRRLGFHEVTTTTPYIWRPGVEEP
ncbi:GNAT family N-acetyltransferase [Allosaccharopolyspora coralli]|nr:GNAT family N-acetyltransferase [Allosaccharopolyspora coralli]